jgi:large-conductance mechanosensitive channel
MKYSFNFVQIANWIYIIRTNLKNLRLRLDKEKISKEEAIRVLTAQKCQLELIKDILNKNARLLGIQNDFLKNLQEIKKQYGIED